MTKSRFLLLAIALCCLSIEGLSQESGATLQNIKQQHVSNPANIINEKKQILDSKYYSRQ